tara:strand:+ start:3075 stop:3710 length:636 start_codon:yes stop_codon:yes gene_type:complete
MKTKINELVIENFFFKQINNFFPTKKILKKTEINKELKNSIKRSLFCFSKIKTKYFKDNNNFFLNSEKYSIFLYFLSNELYQSKKIFSADKVYYLNKFLNGLDLFYKVQMPSIFYLVHPVGTVLGRAKYDDYFVAYQNCTVGSNKNIFPKIGKYVTMRPGSKIIGNSKIGNNCDIGINAVVLDQNIKINSIYLGGPKKFQLKPNKKKKILF